MACMVNTLSDKDSDLNWSQLRQLWTNQMVGWIKGKWEGCYVVTLPSRLGPTAARLFSFIKLYKIIQLYKKREQKGILQYLQWNEGTKFPAD
jgi:hypothetical protein